MHTFSNNAKAETTALMAADMDATTMSVDYAGLFVFIAAASGHTQPVTLTHPSLPGTYEVVLITSSESAPDLTVIRAHEGTLTEWPIGTSVQAQITAKMLERFAQQDSDGSIKSPDGLMPLVLGVGGAAAGPALATKCLAVNGPTRMADSVAIAGYPYLQLTRSAGHDVPDLGLGREIIGGTMPVELGVETTWSAANFYRGSVVVPTTPDGFQYWLHISRPEDEYSFDATEPAFDGLSGPVASDKGLWVPQAMPFDFTTETLYGLVVTEVGFIANTVSAAESPVVSIGVSEDVTRFANGVALSQAVGNAHVHRIPVAAGGPMVHNNALRFRLDTAATDGRFLGRFYWRGFLAEVNLSL